MHAVRRVADERERDARPSAGRRKWESGNAAGGVISSSAPSACPPAAATRSASVGRRQAGAARRRAPAVPTRRSRCARSGQRQPGEHAAVVTEPLARASAMRALAGEVRDDAGLRIRSRRGDDAGACRTHERTPSAPTTSFASTARPSSSDSVAASGVNASWAKPAGREHVDGRVARRVARALRAARAPRRSRPAHARRGRAPRTSSPRPRRLRRASIRSPSRGRRELRSTRRCDSRNATLPGDDRVHARVPRCRAIDCRAIDDRDANASASGDARVPIRERRRPRCERRSREAERRRRARRSMSRGAHSSVSITRLRFV